MKKKKLEKRNQKKDVKQDETFSCMGGWRERESGRGALDESQRIRASNAIPFLRFPFQKWTTNVNSEHI